MTRMCHEYIYILMADLRPLLECMHPHEPADHWGHVQVLGRLLLLVLEHAPHSDQLLGEGLYQHVVLILQVAL